LPQTFDENEVPVVGTESDQDSTAARISQFGTAREATLVRLWGVAEEEWERMPDTGGQLVRAETGQLYDNARRTLEQVVRLLGSPSAAVGTGGGADRLRSSATGRGRVSSRCRSRRMPDAECRSGGA
jgi:hypothetical protein